MRRSYAWCTSFFALILLILASITLVTKAQDEPTTIVVGKNVRASNDGDIGHAESSVAVNPLNPRNVVGTSTVISNSMHTRVYASFDGGASWRGTTPPEALSGEIGDPRVIFTQKGSALFISVNLLQYRIPGHGLDIYRSTDGGRTWGGIAHSKGLDHEVVAIDRTNGRFRGRIYIAGELTRRHSKNPFADRDLFLFASDNDGQSFSQIATVAASFVGKGQLFDGGGVGARGIEVLTDGTLVVHFERYGPKPHTGFVRNYSAISTDGGRTFTVASGFDVHSVNGFTPAQEAKGAADGDLRVFDGGITQFATDSSNGPFGNRIYAIANNCCPGISGQLFLVHSSDSGKTWSAPLTVMANTSAFGLFQPAIAVNDRGVLAIAWYDTRGFPKRDHFNVYVTTSTNGGETLSAPVRVSSESSNPNTAANRRSIKLSDASHTSLSTYSRWPVGGDYIGFDATATPIFHLFWADSRGAAYQLYSAPIWIK